jgi:UDP-N-acetylmuramoyl-tripeptide--D-alanyl-D-alanine ligase
MTTPLWTAHALAAAAEGEWDGEPSGPINGFSIDTRSLSMGDVFVALTHARDGHAFVSDAFKAGAVAALVKRAHPRQTGDGALLRVDDPLRALERIGAAARARLDVDARVIAITGSAGKTGTKEMLRACLAPLGNTHAPEKSFNNQWGVPLTLARMPADTRFAVIEIGMNHAGEITPLTRLTRPHIAAITNVLPVHVGNFADGEIGVANAKAEIFLGLDAEGTAVILRESPHFERLRAAAQRRGAAIITFGTHAEADVRATAIEVTATASTVDVTSRTTQARYVVGAPGRHLAENSLVVAAVLERLGLGWETTLAPLAQIAAPAGRGARTSLAIPGGALLLIDESYNANPASMRAALANLTSVAREAFPRRIAVLGDMRELGADSQRYHLELVEPIVASGADHVFACGPYMQGLFERLPAAIRGAWAPTSDDLVPALAATLRPGDVVMIKGSLGTNMAPLVGAVRALAAGRPMQ